MNMKLDTDLHSHDACDIHDLGSVFLIEGLGEAVPFRFKYASDVEIYKV